MKHIAAQRHIAIIAPAQQIAQARNARAQLVEVGKIVLRLGEV